MIIHLTAEVPEQTKIIQNLIIDADGHTNSCCTHILEFVLYNGMCTLIHIREHLTTLGSKGVLEAL